MTRSTISLFGVAALTWMGGEAHGQVITKEVAPRICAAGAVDPLLALGEVYLKAQANQAFIATRYEAAEVSADASPEEVAIQFLIVQPLKAEGVTDTQLADIAQGSDDLLMDIRRFRANDPGDTSVFRVRTVPPKATINDNIFDTLEAFFRRPDAPGPRLTVLCPAAKPGNDGRDQAGGTPSSQVTFALRGSANDLLIPNGSPAFEKASASRIGFVDDNEAGTTTFDVNTVAGIGVTVLDEINTPTRAFAFAHFKQTDKNTDDPTDNDNAGDIRFLSLGALVTGRIFAPSPDRESFGLIANYGLLVAHTSDLANSAESVRGRLLFNDIVLDIPGIDSNPCGGPSTHFLFVDLPADLYVDCAIETYLEGGYVFDPGTNADFQTLDDDSYLGVGGKATMNFGFSETAFLKGFGIRVSGEYMAVLLGGLDDPHRFEASVTYKLPGVSIQGQDLGTTLSFGYVTGQDLTTFQDEEVLRLGLELKY